MRKILYVIFLSSNLLGEGAGETQLSPDSLDLDAIWETVVWEEIEEITTIEGEVEQVITTAGVRGAEAEDEILTYVYYRKSMKGLTKLDLQSALGKLINKRSMTTDSLALRKISGYIFQIKKKLKKL
ncbi:MAG TPA: hypothetical protein DHN29_24330 [Cytophagales bacterium]|nr:hypothetical protein [Cytophagales bacterium]